MPGDAIRDSLAFQPQELFERLGGAWGQLSFREAYFAGFLALDLISSKQKRQSGGYLVRIFDHFYVCHSFLKKAYTYPMLTARRRCAQRCGYSGGNQISSLFSELTSEGPGSQPWLLAGVTWGDSTMNRCLVPTPLSQSHFQVVWDAARSSAFLKPCSGASGVEEGLGVELRMWWKL